MFSSHSLSLLLNRVNRPTARANLVSKIEASEQALSELFPETVARLASLPGDCGGDGGFCACRHIPATPQATSFDTMSHSPSLDRIRLSSSAVRSVTVTFGSGHGLLDLLLQKYQPMLEYPKRVLQLENMTQWISPDIDELIKKLKAKSTAVYLVSVGFRQMINGAVLFSHCHGIFG